MYRPVREGLELGVASGPGALSSSRTYTLRVTSPVTNHDITRDWLSQQLVRRYEEAVIASVVVVVLGWEGALPSEPTASTTSVAAEAASVVLPEGVSVTIVHVGTPGGGAPIGEAAAKALRRACDAKPSLVVLVASSAGAAPVLVDSFVPAYPVLISSSVLACTPLQLLQCNGCALGAAGPADVLASVAARVAITLGAVLVGQGAELPAASTLKEDLERYLHCSGLSSFEKGVYRDGRVLRVEPGLAAAVPFCAHGWLSHDTRLLLSAAVSVCKPRALLELGAWYGLSSRHIMARAAEEGLCSSFLWTTSRTMPTTTGEDPSLFVLCCAVLCCARVHLCMHRCKG
jgi:hypothetical protein